MTSRSLTFGLIATLTVTSVAGLSDPVLASNTTVLASAAPVIESSCGILVLNGAGTEYRPVKNFHIYNTTTIRVPKSDLPIMALSCIRDSLVPGPGDDRAVSVAPNRLVLNDGVRYGVLTLEKGKYKFVMLSGLLRNDEQLAVKNVLALMQKDADNGAKKKKKGKKIAGCVGGGIIGGLLGVLFAPKRNRGTAAVVGFAAGCAAGWSFAANWSQTDKEGLDQASQQALDEPTGRMGWQAPESGQQVQFQVTDTGEQNLDVEFQHLDSVEEPPEGSRVISRPFRTIGKIALRSSPDSISADNIVGSFNADQTVEIVAETPDRRWVMIGEDGVIVGYAVRDGFAELGQPLSKVRTNRHLVDVKAPARPVVAKRKGKPRSAAPVMMAQVAPPPSQTQIRTVKLSATTQCKSLVAATGQKSAKRTGCQAPGGKWVFA